jgi:peptidoglycan/LPS O-acetylase OafA/YrhL
MFIAHDYFPADFFVAISLMLTLVFSAIGYYVVELPGQKLGRWIETVGRRKTSTHPVDRSTERVG